ncbi:MAG: hypothetical protein WC858_04620 [Parcubacteria group bacterium]
MIRVLKKQDFHLNGVSENVTVVKSKVTIATDLSGMERSPRG